MAAPSSAWDLEVAAASIGAIATGVCAAFGGPKGHRNKRILIWYIAYGIGYIVYHIWSMVIRDSELFGGPTSGSSNT